MSELYTRYPSLNPCKEDIENAIKTIIACYENGGKLLLCGNGGSAADSLHIAGELMKGFLKKRPMSEEKRAEMKKNAPEIPDEILDKLQEGLPAIALMDSAALFTAFLNDVDPDLVYAQGVNAMGREGDVLIAISTSGNAKNCHAAALTAKAIGMKVISLSGEGGGKLAGTADVAIRVPEKETFKVQELHLPVYHELCARTEAHFYQL